MFKCLQSNKTELDIIENLGVCDVHGEQFVFVCSNEIQQCQKKPLLCMKCLEAHKGHQWESIEKYFPASFKKSLETGTSVNGPKLIKVNDSINYQFQRLRVRINRKIDEMQHDLKVQMNSLMKKYPIKHNFGIKGSLLSNDNAEYVIKIKQRQKNTEWTNSMERYYSVLLTELSNMINNLFIDFDASVDDMRWENLTMEQADSGIEDFIKKYEGVINNEIHYFKFSQNFKNEGIRVTESGLKARYVKTKPSKPAILTEKKLTPVHNTIYYRMTKMESKLMVFEATLVAIGVCLPRSAKSFGYRNLLQPSHGGFLMGSNGRSYHSSLPQYDKKDLGFTFSEGDIVAVSVDFRNKTVSFNKKAFFNKSFTMELMIKDDQMESLKPCLLFHGDEGAIVHIVQEEELEKKKKKNGKNEIHS